MLKEIAESKEKLLNHPDQINRRKKRTAKEETKTEGDESYKNATELFADKTIAFLYVLFCEWAIENPLKVIPLEERDLIAVKEIHAVAMDSIRKIGEDDEENYAFKVVLGLLDKNEGDIKTPNDQLRLH